MITSLAHQDRGVDATVDDSCDDANMQYLEWWLTVETVKLYFAPGNQIYNYNIMINAIIFKSCFFMK